MVERAAPPRRALGWRSRVAFAALYVPLLFVQVHALWIERVGVASNPPDELGRTTPEIAGAVTVTQTFRVEAAGFHSVVLYPRRTSASTSGQVVLELEEMRGDEAIPLVRVTPPASDVVRHSRYEFSFPAIEQPAGRQFRVSVSLPATPLGQGLTLLTVREDRYRPGRLTIDGREQWGDLAFDTRATGAVRAGRLDQWLGAYPPWMQSPWFLAAGLLVLNAWLLWAVRLATRDMPLTPHRHAAARPPIGRDVRPRVIVAGGLALVAVLVSWWWVRDPGIDLVVEFPDAEKRTRATRVHDGFEVQTVALGGRLRRCILAVPPSRITWTVEVPAGGQVRGFAGMRPDTWTGMGDGALMRAGVSDGTTYEEGFRRYFNPVVEVRDRELVPIALDLARHAGRRVEIIFNTEPGEIGNPVDDATLWCEPRVVGR